jgi:hypothetical protein
VKFALHRFRVIANRTISKAVPVLLVLALTLAVGWAGTTEGSTATARAFTDGSAGQVMIFDGDFFNIGSVVTSFQLFDSNFGQGSRFVTPVLFEETSAGIFVVRGIGTSDTVTPGSSPQTFAFGLMNGTATTSSGLFTFGFIEAAVNSSGTQTTSSSSSVDFDQTVDPGAGVSGVGTNDWVFTPSPGAGTVNVALGTTFFIPGGGRTGNFALNSPSFPDRTYSANLSSTSLSAVPEPGTISLLTTGGGLLLLGLVRPRRRR